jgi:hypothetical protein
MELTLLTIPTIAYLLNETLKKAGMPSKLTGLVNIGVGLIGGYLIQPNIGGIVAGFLAGLSAGGAYSAIKNINQR